MSNGKAKAGVTAYDLLFSRTTIWMRCLAVVATEREAVRTAPVRKPGEPVSAVYRVG